ncbi:uncharacterized protein LOC102210623 [Pundamilia nyererei]|uniref:Uncharacterized protein LOC102210623 n=1 Tax=Pundamilia nyererei TaxID=303518 RepID=A0A9Y6J7K2_9CICH|nr:PREDICTED: uncharacterized protein LOC102210623 [Pundamilia nyererei]
MAVCDLLKEAPFSSCNSDIDPEPYITACTDTLCKYPAVDGLNCQFLKAYARACSLHNHALDGWTSKTSCSSEAFCQDRTCSDHEFCGEKTVGGDTRCFCRAIFASKYQENNSLGDPTVCMQDSASLTLVGCLLEDKGIDYSSMGPGRAQFEKGLEINRQIDAAAVMTLYQSIVVKRKLSVKAKLSIARGQTSKHALKHTEKHTTMKQNVSMDREKQRA